MVIRYLIIQGRNFGDAVISTALINSVGESFPDVKLDVFTRPVFKSIYKNNPYINKIYYANFPVGTNKNFNFREAIKLLKQINQFGYIERIKDYSGNFRIVKACRLCQSE